MKTRIMKAMLLVLMSMVAFSVHAYDFEAGGIYYKKNGNNAEVTSGDKEYSGSVTIPSTVNYGGTTYSVTSIEEQAFYGCGGLTSIKSLIEVPFETGSDCFKYVNKSIPLYVPQGTKSLYQNTGGWKEFTNIIEMDSSEPSTPTTTTEQGPNYLQIWFKDGHTERHLLSLVKSISATKYDINGFLHSNYQMQQIVMEDTTYSYNISDIDNMSFRKVDKEEAKQNIIAARTFIEPIFEQCSSVEDMEQHLNEIRNLASVEDAYSTGSDVVVQVKDWRTMTYHFHEYEDEEDLSAKANSVRSALQGLKKTRKAQSADNPLKAVIYFQMENDNARTFPIFGKKNILKDIQSDLEDAGIVVKFIPQDGSDEVDKFADFDFFENGIYDYDIVFLDTHGSSGKDWFGRHWICTRSKFNDSEEDSKIDEKYDFGEASIAVCKGVIDEDLLFKESVTYWQISEDFINNSAKSFHRNNPRIVYNAACHSLDGLQESDVIDDKHIGSSIYRRGNDSFAQAFIAKGADIYIGYNQSDYLGEKTGELFFKSMLNGCSEAKAFVDLPDNKKKETGYYESAELIDIVSSSYADYLQNQDRRSLFIIKNKTSEISAIDLLSYNINGKLPLHGTTTMIDPEESDVRCGFKYNIDGVDYPVLFCDKVIDKNKNADNVSFSASIGLKPGQSISYCSVTYDDVYFNNGEIRQFTVPETVSLALSTTSLEVSVGSSSTVEITSGSGNYTISCDKPSIATISQSGSTITVTGVSAGPATITITDTQTQKTAIIAVTVTEGSKAIVNAETFTVNGVSFKMISVEGGTFWMGAADDDTDADYDERPRHQVTLSSYSIGETEVTQELWKAVMGKNPSHDKKENSPVEFITFDDCLTFVSKLSQTTGQQFRLPTEAEWEYAARGGKYSHGYKYSGSNDINDVAWYIDNSERAIHEVGQKYPNELGLYDMSGNVMEYCQDWYDQNYYSNSPSVNPCNTSATSYRSCRGGSFNANAGRSRVSFRFAQKGGTTYIGLRLALPDLLLESNTLYLTSGETKIVKIISGSGNYSIESVIPSGVMTAKISGSSIAINAIESGVASITVKDNQTQVRAKIKVFVTTPGSPIPPEPIDLGLPSGLKWASYNVGASKPEEKGGYYAWGETEEKDVYEWTTYKWCKGSQRSLTKYCDKSNYGNVDNKLVLDPEDDVAHVKWGGEWRMPTLEEYKELIANTTSEWTTLNGVKGCKFTSKTSANYIFLPAAGDRWNSKIYNAGAWGYYWSSSLLQSHPGDACSMYFMQFGPQVGRDSSRDYGTRLCGRCVRPVCK